jgi:hypothetical protein
MQKTGVQVTYQGNAVLPASDLERWTVYSLIKLETNA